MTLILGRKRGMTQLFAEDGTVTGVTVVEAGPCVVTQVRTEEKDNYSAVQLGFEDVRDKRSCRSPSAATSSRPGVAPEALPPRRTPRQARRAVGGGRHRL